MAIDHTDPIAGRLGRALPEVLPQGHARAALRPASGAAPLRLPETASVVVLADAPGPEDDPGPNVVALLALWLAQDGLSVLVHRPGAPGARGGAAEVLRSLGIAPAHDAADVADRWARREPALVASGLLDPGATASRPAWVLAAPRGPRRLLRVVPGGLSDGAPDAVDAAGPATRDGRALLRLGGPWPSDACHCPGLVVWIAGRLRPDLGAAAFDEPLGCATPMPRGTGAAAMAVFVQDVLSGARPMPAALQALAAQVSRALHAIDGPLAADGDSCL